MLHAQLHITSGSPLERGETSLGETSLGETSLGETSLGRRVRQARESRRLTLRELARRVEKTTPYLDDIENDRRVPTEALIRDLADALDLDVESLIPRAERAPTDTERYLARHPAAARVIRAIMENSLTDDEILALIASCGDLAHERSGPR